MTKVTVTNETAGFKAGTVIETTEDIGSFFRAMYLEANGNDPDLDDDEILSVVEHIQEKEPPLSGDAFDVAVLELMEAGGVSDDDKADDTLSADIRDVAILIASDKATGDMVREYVIIADKFEQRPALIAQHLLSILEIKQRQLLPWPDSKIGEGNNVDQYEVDYIKNNGERGKRKRYKIKELIALQPPFIAVQGEIDAINKNIPANAQPGPADADALKNLSKRRSNIMKAYNRAIKVMLNWDKFADHEHVGVEWKTGDDDATLVESTYCIQVINKHKKLDGVTLSVNSFIKLKPRDNMRFGEVLASGVKKRAPKVPQTASKFIIEKADDIELSAVELVIGLRKNPVWAELTSKVKMEDTENKGRLARLVLSELENLVNELLDKELPGGKRVRSLLQADREWEKAQGNAPAKVA